MTGFIELTRYPCGTKVLINASSISSVYPSHWARKNPNPDGTQPMTVIQEVTSSDNYWEVKESYEEVRDMILLLTSPMLVVSEMKGGGE